MRGACLIWTIAAINLPIFPISGRGASKEDMTLDDNDGTDTPERCQSPYAVLSSHAVASDVDIDMEMPGWFDPDVFVIVRFTASSNPPWRP